MVETPEQAEFVNRTMGFEPGAPPLKRKRQFLVTKIAAGVAAGIFLFIVGIVVLVAVLVSAGSTASNTTSAGNPDTTAAAPAAAPAATTSAFDPQPSDITVKVKIDSKDNFGDAGSVITYEPDATLNSSAFDPNVTYQVTYEVRGGQDGPEIHSFTVTGNQMTYDQQTTQTASVNQKLTARVTSVDATS